MKTFVTAALLAAALNANAAGIDDCNGVNNCNQHHRTSIDHNSHNRTYHNDNSNRTSSGAESSSAGLGIGTGVGVGGDGGDSASLSGVTRSGNSASGSAAFNGGNTTSIAGDRTRLRTGDTTVTDGDTTQRVRTDQSVGDTTLTGGVQRVRDGDTFVGVGGDTTTIEGAEGDSIAVSESNTTTNINNTDWEIPAHADAGVAYSMLQGCYGIGGMDARGSGREAAGGLTLNIFKLTNDRCVLAAKALEAQANGNLNGYATMTCADRATWKGYRTVMSAVEDRKVSKNEAIVSCIEEVTAVALAQSDLAKRVARLETAAHRPNSKTLLLEEHSH